MAEVIKDLLESFYDYLDYNWVAPLELRVTPSYYYHITSQFSWYVVQDWNNPSDFTFQGVPIKIDNTVDEFCFI